MADITDKIFDDLAVSGTTVYYSKKISMKRGSLFSLHAIAEEVTSTLAGTFVLQASNEAQPLEDQDGFWKEQTDVTWTAVSSTTSQLHNIGNAASRYYRVKYTNATGTGTINIWANFGEA